MRVRRWVWLAALFAAPATAVGQQLTPPDTTVRAILFYSPTCPHCQEVITESLPPILEYYGERLQIAGVNTATPGGEQLFRATIQHLAIPPERVGVPTLIVGSSVLVGALEIPGRLPGIVDVGLQGAGIDWPDVPLIRQALDAQGVAARSETEEDAAAEEPAAAPRAEPPAVAGTQTTEAPQPRAADAPAASDPTGSADPDAQATPTLAAAIDPDARAALVHDLSVIDRLRLDPAGNATALAVLVLMLSALAIVAGDVLGRIRIPTTPDWIVPILAVTGIVVASYLAVVEVSGAEAVCGPVGDCNTVQQSPYARLLGVPVGLLGVLGYGALLVAWLLGRTGDTVRRRAARRVTWWLAMVATLFSFYLTVLEPFVIGASCAWCLTSAMLATLVLVAATPGLHSGSPPGVGVSPTERPSVSH
jgi:uncharacterized membrane protein